MSKEFKWLFEDEKIKYSINNNKREPGTYCIYLILKDYEAENQKLKEQLTLTEKALEFACEKLTFCLQPYESTCKCEDKQCKDCKLEYLMSKAKEMMKSE